MKKEPKLKSSPEFRKMLRKAAKKANRLPLKEPKLGLEFFRDKK